MIKDTISVFAQCLKIKVTEGSNPTTHPVIKVCTGIPKDKNGAQASKLITDHTHWDYGLTLGELPKHITEQPWKHGANSH
jgi:hypothetical protein